MRDARYVTYVLV